MTVKAPLEKTDPEIEQELDALIEEAQRRARRRRLAITAVIVIALAGVGLTLFFSGGGSGGGGESGFGDDPLEPGASNDGASGSQTAVTKSECPPSAADLDRRLHQKGIAGCQVRMTSELPSGWEADRAKFSVFPQPLPGFLGPSGVVYSDAPQRPHAFITAPHLSAGQTSVAVVASGAPRPGATAEEIAITADDLEPPADTNGAARARIELVLGSFRHEAFVRTRTEAPYDDALENVNSLLNSLSVTEKICPCGKGSTHDDLLPGS